DPAASESHGALGTQLAAGSFRIEGVTPDGYAIVSDLKAGKVNAVNIATGASQRILDAPLAAGAPFSWGNRTVLLWHDLSLDGTTAQLTAWSAAGGAHLLTATAGSDLWNGARVSPDGGRIAYWAHADATHDTLIV